MIYSALCFYEYALVTACFIMAVRNLYAPDWIRDNRAIVLIMVRVQVIGVLEIVVHVMLIGLV